MKNTDLLPHTIILPGYCPVAICATKKIADDLAAKYGYKDCYIVRTNKEHIALIAEGVTD